MEKNNFQSIKTGRHCQDKLIEMVIIHKTKYTDKFLTMISAKQYLNVKTNPTKTMKSEIQQVLRKIKYIASEEQYKWLYPI